MEHLALLMHVLVASKITNSKNIFAKLLLIQVNSAKCYRLVVGKSKPSSSAQLEANQP